MRTAVPADIEASKGRSCGDRITHRIASVAARRKPSCRSEKGLNCSSPKNTHCGVSEMATLWTSMIDATSLLVASRGRTARAIKKKHEAAVAKRSCDATMAQTQSEI